MVLLKQPTPPGFVGARHPTIANDEMQMVTEQGFTVDGKELKFVKEPQKGQTNYWTLGKEENTGWDTNIIVYTPKAGATSIKLDATYKGFTGITQYIPGQKSERKLSAQEKTEFLRLDESLFTTTKGEMDNVLSSVGLLRNSGEKPVDYAVRVARWTRDNIRYLSTNADNNVTQAIAQRKPGNCNQYANVQVFILRSQGIPAVIESGLVGDNREPHVGCRFFDEDSGRWYRMPQGTQAKDPSKVFGWEGNTQFLIFQRDTTFEFSSDIRKFGDAGEDTGVTDQTGSGRWNVFDGGVCVAGVVGTFDPTRSWSRPVESNSTTDSELVAGLGKR